MPHDDPPSDYAAHGPYSDPGASAALFDGLPADVPALCRTIQAVLIHDAEGAHLYGAMPWSDAPPSRATLPVAERLAQVGTLAARPPAQRTIGTCRDFAVLMCAILRQQGTPARVRCGFASYFEPGWFEDHWVCEYWHARDRRWALADAQLDEAHRRHFGIAFDCSDLPMGTFLSGRDIWPRCRSGAIDPARCGHGNVAGLWFVAVNLARDLLALRKREVSDWDSWRDAERRVLDHAVIARCDRWAEGVEPASTQPFWAARSAR